MATCGSEIQSRYHFKIPIRKIIITCNYPINDINSLDNIQIVSNP